MDHRQLLERECELGVLDAAVEAAAAGTGAVVLLADRPGRENQRAAGLPPGGVRAGPRAGRCVRRPARPAVLGPLREAARGDRDGALATGLAGSDRDAILAAVLSVLSAPGPPTGPRRARRGHGGSP
jgi:hypothetical protein